MKVGSFDGSDTPCIAVGPSAPRRSSAWCRGEVHAPEEVLEAGVGAERVEWKQRVEMCHQAVALRR